jgi:membrane-bound ClpP family serine protease
MLSLLCLAVCVAAHQVAQGLQVYSLASFQNAALSSLVLLLGSLVILAGEYLQHGNHQWTLLTGAALALAMIANE